MQKKIMKYEISGIFFVIIMSVFLQNLYSLCGRELIGVMFGAVNDSIWETGKTIMFSYLLWSMIELLCIHPPFKKFTVVKIFTLYYLGLSYIILCLIFLLLGSESHSLPEFTAAVVCISTASFLSFRFLFSDKKFEKLFAPAFCMFLLFTAIFCSFTPFPPKIYIFMDRTTHLYGIIPEHIDAGAVALDTLYRI